MKRVAVLGAGLAGLRGADVLSEGGIDVFVIEKEDAPGGLARTVREGDFHFDLGPHRFHTEKPHILEQVKLLLPGRLLEIERLSRIRLLDRYFRYPLSFSDVLGKMPLQRSAGMVLSYFAERSAGLFRKGSDEDFRSWVTSRFGKKLYDLYFGPYTEKLWGCPADLLSADWASQRITVPRLSELVRATISPGRSSARTLVSTFHYPEGGIGRICETLADRVARRGGRIVFGTRPRSIEPLGKGGYRIVLEDSEIDVDGILSSIPVTEYARLLGGTLSGEILAMSESLHYRAIVFVVLKLGRRVEADDHWIYIPEEKYLFNRISFPGSFDPEADAGGSQLVFEFTCSEGDDVWSGRSDLMESSVSGGVKLGLFDREDVVSGTVARNPHAYPVYTLGYSRALSPLLNALDGLHNSVTCGRQGRFIYNNMDHSLEMGEYAAMELMGSKSLSERFRWTSDTWADG